MKAILRRRYGSPGVLTCEEVEQPAPKDDEVLIRVRAAAVNPRDSHFTTGEPYFIRMMFGLREPKDIRLGTDVAGRVEAIGRNVTQFRPGDAVFGWCQGAFAEYACAGKTALAAKPESVTFEQAATVATAGLTALQGLRNKGRLQSGQTVLINGAAGGIGTFGVQIATFFGASVTGVCSTRNLDFVRSIGAAEVIDYTQQDFTRRSQRYDLILDCVGNHSMLSCRRVLTSRGTYVAIGGTGGRWMIGALSRAITAPLVSRFVSQRLVMSLTRGSQEDLAFVRDLISTGKVRPVIGRRYRLTEVPEAIRQVGEGHAQGKVVINVQ
jgi:NADPH:quinone reductase-like Zn-dependent oxidoreductase